MTIELKHNQKIHFIGIGGIGMRGLAELMLHWGHVVTGSDLNASENTTYLQKIGAGVIIGHNSENIQSPDLVVYSSAIGSDNEELKTAGMIGVPVIKRADLLALVMKSKKYAIAVSGTHGKTTTTSMISKVFEYAGLDPITIVGGVDQNIGSTTRLGKGNIVIVEADEFDHSFLKLSPTHIVVTSIDHDHQEDYRSINEVKESFLEFFHKLPDNGVLAACLDDKNIQAIIPKIKRKIITYSINESSDVIAVNSNPFKGLTQFKVQTKAGDFEVNLPIHGQHNIQNALAAVALGQEFQIPLETVSQALSLFKPVKRRMQILRETDDFVLIDDYAHHPAEIKATLTAARNRWQRRIIAIFQPHLYSRTKTFYMEFAEALGLADSVIVTGIYPAREKPIEGVSGKMIINEFSKHQKAYYFENKFLVPAFVKKYLNKGDVVIIMGAGDICSINKHLLKLD